jgi:transcriptional regulator with XRE-family HTH domain
MALLRGVEFHVTDWSKGNTRARMRTFKSHRQMTQEELACLLGVSVTSVSRWMNGRNVPDSRTRRAIQNYVEGVER